jgi:hypothetical protein
MYFRTDTGETFATHSEIRASFSSGDVVVLFLDVITDEDLADRGVFPLAAANSPIIKSTEIAIPLQPELVDGVWTRIWEIRDATAEELSERAEREAEAARAAVPAKVTRRQARQALLLEGLLDDIPAAIAALDDGTPGGNQKMRMAQIEWEDSLEFERARPLVIEIAAAIGLDATALDQLFITAAGL